jgi:hypothetical protein
VRPYSAALVVEVADDERDPRGVLDEAVIRLGAALVMPVPMKAGIGGR